MKTPIQFIEDTILKPGHDFCVNYLGKTARHKYFQGIAKTIFNLSEELPVIMLGCNAISIASSHIAQYQGLKKSNRENKDYLMKQELVEGVADIGLNIIPPFMINNALTKRLDAGTLSTKSSRENLRYIIAPTAGVNQAEIYSTEHLTPTTKIVKNMYNNFKLFLRKKKLIPEKLMGKIKFVEPDINTKVPVPKMEEITKKFDRIRKGKFDGFYNGSAHDEICGQRNGMLLMVAIAYGIVATNVIMPIIKNLITNHFSKKEKIRKYNSQESIDRRARYTNLKLLDNTLEKPTLDIHTLAIPTQTTTATRIAKPLTQKNIFSTFNGISSQSNRLRI